MGNLRQFRNFFCLLFLLAACTSKPTNTPTLQLSEAEDKARIALMDRFDLLLQADSIYEAMSMVDSVDEIEEKPDWLQWSNHEIRHKLAEKLEIYDQALFELNQLLQFFEARRADETLLLQTYYRRGDILLKMRQYDLAFEDFFKGAGEGNDAKDACSNANFNHRLGMVSYQQTNYEDAKQYFLQAFPLFDGCDDKYSALYRQQEVASNIGLCYWRLQQYDSSLVWYDQSLRIIERLPLNSKADEYRAEIARWVTQGNKGLALYQNNSFTAGRKLMRNSFEWNLRFVYGDKSHAAFIGNSLAAFLINEKKLKEASAIMQKLDSAGVLQPNSPAQLNALLNKVNWFAAMGKGDSSYYHFGQYLLVSDTIRQNSRELIKMNTRLLLRGLDKDYALKAEQQKSEARLLLNRSILALLLLGILLLISVFITLKRSRRQNAQLAALNDRVQDQNKVLEATFDQLKFANEELQSLNQQQSRLLRVVAHDLRNPLAAIYSMSNMKLEEEQQDPENAEFFQLAVKACKGGLDLINDLLESMEVQQHHGRDLSFERVGLKEFLTDTMQLVQHRAQEKGIELQLGDINPHWEVEMDVERLRRALINLITNAIKFSERGTTVQLLCATHPKGLQLEVIDQGIGIAEADLTKLFESFTPTKRQGTEGEKAFGLGLSITKHIVQMHQSEIEVESRPGQGATFRIIIPEKLVFKGVAIQNNGDLMLKS